MSDLDQTDALAAEYVLGTLDSAERAQARALLGADQGFAAKVELWERRLGELHLMVEPVEPDAKIWVRIKAKLSEVQARPDVSPPEEQVLPPEPAPALPPSLDAIEARISEAATALATAASTPPSPEQTPVATADAASLPSPDEPLVSISDPTPMPTSETIPVPPPDATAAPISDATAAPPSDATAAPHSEMAPPAPTSQEVAAPASEAAAQASAVVEPVSGLPEVPPAAPAAAPGPPLEATRITATEPSRQLVAARGGLRRWRALALLMLLLVAALAGLAAAWKFAPDRVPTMLQPAELMRHLDIAVPARTPPRRPASPQSQFEE
jgi:hypothetical protein